MVYGTRENLFFFKRIQIILTKASSKIITFIYTMRIQNVASIFSCFCSDVTLLNVPLNKVKNIIHVSINLKNKTMPT